MYQSVDSRPLVEVIKVICSTIANDNLHHGFEKVATLICVKFERILVDPRAIQIHWIKPTKLHPYFRSHSQFDNINEQQQIDHEMNKADMSNFSTLLLPTTYHNYPLYFDDLNLFVRLEFALYLVLPFLAQAQAKRMVIFMSPLLIHGEQNTHCGIFAEAYPDSQLRDATAIFHITSETSTTAINFPETQRELLRPTISTQSSNRNTLLITYCHLLDDIKTSNSD